MFYSPIHSAEERTTVLYQAVKVHFLKEVTLRLAEVISVKPSTADDADDKCKVFSN